MSEESMVHLPEDEISEAYQRGRRDGAAKQIENYETGFRIGKAIGDREGYERAINLMDIGRYASDMEEKAPSALEEIEAIVRVFLWEFDAGDELPSDAAKALLGQVLGHPRLQEALREHREASPT